MAHKHQRSSARKCAAQILYSGAIRDVSSFDLLNNGEMTCLESPMSDYAYSLVKGVEERKQELDGLISDVSTNWSTDRMPLMDLTILRLALFEMLYIDAVPISVSINEAVELAKDFGGEDDSPRFVNGMLGNIAKQIEGGNEDVAASIVDAEEKGQLTGIGESDE